MKLFFSLILSGVISCCWSAKLEKPHSLSCESSFDLAIQALKEKAAQMGMSSNEMQRYIIQAQEQQLYNAGRFYGTNGATAILGRLSNPFAWAQFFESLKKR